ncbi:MAG TPA: hypothetical protein VFZ48_02625 [Candidatus Saccharimonadales bacterium]
MNILASKSKMLLLKGILIGVAAVLIVVLGVYLVRIIGEKPALVVSHSTPPAAPKSKPKLANGKTTLFPHSRLVALYGTPDAPALGVLGEHSFGPAAARIKKLASEYQRHTKQHMYPAMEIIATVAAAEPTANNDYSREVDFTKLEAWIRAAEKQGIYIVLDLQPGRSSFVTQAKQLEKLLTYPHVGLALDPEWRLSRTQVHLEQIGSVTAAEVNATATWLARLVRKHQLPQKLFLLHQFRNSMIQDRTTLKIPPELAAVIQMDGHGAQFTKLDTWRATQTDLPSTLRLGWKNFYNEDLPMLTPAQTLKITPVPWFVSYQ